LILSLSALPAAAEPAPEPPKRFPESETVQPWIGEGLELAIIPTPKQASFPGRFFQVTKAAVVCPAGYGRPVTVEKLSKSLLVEVVQAEAGKWAWPADVDTVVLMGDGERNPLVQEALGAVASQDGKSGAPLLLDAAKRAEMGEEGYLLFSGWYPAKRVNLVVLAGNSPTGDFWAAQSLRQMVVAKRDQDRKLVGVFIREGTVLDWPSFEFRGNKRPKPWEYRYKANFAWFFSPELKKGAFADHFRVHGGWIHHVDCLNASDQHIDLLVNGGTFTDAKGKPQTMAGAKGAYEQGCRLFTLKYDDTGRAMTEETKAKFNDDYFAAQSHFLREMHKRIKALDPANRVYFLPQPYWLNAYDFEEYVGKLRAAGGVPEDMGLTFCGVEVSSQRITERSVEDTMEAFGLTKTKALIYDNLGRGGDLFAIYGRDPNLYKHLSGIFPERGTPVTRITVHDYLWNPEAYDPQRSLKLACRELAGGDPEGYRKLYDFVSFYNANRDLDAYLPRPETIAKLKADTQAMSQKLLAAAPLLAESELAKECDLQNEILGGAATWGETAGLKRRTDQEASMALFGYREAKVRRTGQAPEIDGKLGDKAWEASEALTDFVSMATKPEAPLPPEKQSVFRLLYDDENLYLAGQLRLSAKPDLTKFQRWYPDAVEGKARIYAWRVPCVEVFLDPGHTQLTYFQCAINLLNWHFDYHSQAYGDPLPGGPRWSSGVRYKVVVDENSATYEAAFPLKNLGAAPKPGEVWGAQFCRNVEGASTWSYMYDFGGFHAVKQFGHLIFE
jgi:hypothetical protein